LITIFFKYNYTIFRTHRFHLSLVCHAYNIKILGSNHLLFRRKDEKEGDEEEADQRGSGGCRETFLPTMWPQTFGPIITLISSTEETYCPADASTADAALYSYVTYEEMYTCAGVGMCETCRFHGLHLF